MMYACGGPCVPANGFTMSLMTKTQPVLAAALPFEDGVVAVMRRLHETVLALVGALPEAIRRAVDLERALRIEKKLAWQLFRLSRKPEFGDAANVPSLASIARVIDAARKKGVPEPVLSELNEAFGQFENFAVIHGGDRHGLISMVSGLSGEKSEQYEIGVRKSLFRGNAHVWGVHARLAVRTGIFVPRAGTDRVEDVALVIGDHDLAKRRQSDPLVMLWWLWTSDDPKSGSTSTGSTSGPGSANPADGVVDHGLEILPEFCTYPLPKMVRRQAADGTPETELIFPPGRGSAISTYSLQRRENTRANPGGSFFGRTLFTMPLETMVWEMLVPVGWSDPSTARASVYGRRHHPELVYEERTYDLLGQRETLDYLGVHEGVPPLAGAPNHANAVRHSIERAGWAGTRFDVYRCSVEYPVMYTMLVVRADALQQ